MHMTLLKMAPILACLSMLAACAGPSAEPPVNRVIGDESAIALTGERPTDAMDEDARIQIHLAYVEGLLRRKDTADLTADQQQARALNLARLRQYIEAGAFPRNDDHPDARRPTFVDREGRICAVGHLAAQDLGVPAIVALAKDVKYDFIEDIDDPTFERWAATSGFSTRELAMIQPSYGWREPPLRPPVRPPVRPPMPPKPTFPQAKIDAAWNHFAVKLNACISEHLDADRSYPEPWLPVNITWGKSGSVERMDFQLSRTPEKIDACVRDAAEGMKLGAIHAKLSRFKLVKIHPRKAPSKEESTERR